MRGPLRYKYSHETKYGINILRYAVWTVAFGLLYPETYQPLSELYGDFLTKIFGWAVAGSLVCLWLLMAYHILSDKDRKYRKTVFEKGECFDGEIIDFIIKKEKYSEFGWCYRIDTTYILHVKCRNQVITTPELNGSPERILKSAKCKVYFYNGEKYVTDFDERIFRIGKRLLLPKSEIETKGILKIPFIQS